MEQEITKPKRKYHYNQKLPDNYYNYFDICKMEKIPDGTAKAAVGRNGVEGIKKINELKPIEYLFEVFEKFISGKKTNVYGIRRIYYDEWKATGVLPSIRTGRPKLGKAELKLHIPKELKDQLTKAIKKANSMSVTRVSQSDVVAVAIQEYLQRRPIFLED